MNYRNRIPEPGTTISGFADSLKKKINKKIETKLIHVSVPGHLFIANIIQNHDNRFYLNIMQSHDNRFYLNIIQSQITGFILFLSKLRAKKVEKLCNLS
jgi:hypothetical protein